MNTNTIPTIRPYSGGPDATATVLAFGDRTFHVGHIGEGEQSRQTHGGPMVPGPWAYAFSLPFAITQQGDLGKRPSEPVPIHDGALIRVCGYVYQVRVDRYDIELDPA